MDKVNKTFLEPAREYIRVRSVDNVNNVDSFSDTYDFISDLPENRKR